MSTQYMVYAGTSLFIPKQDKTADVSYYACENCCERYESTYCPDCGGRIVQKWEQEPVAPDLYRAPLLRSGNFQCINDGAYIVPTADKNSLGIRIWESDEFYAMPEKNTFSLFPLMKQLDELGIKYEVRYGLVGYWS